MNDPASNYRIEDSNRFGPLSAERLTAWEMQHNVQLPSDYRTFLLEHNGGVPLPSIIDFVEDGRPTSNYVHSFLGIHDGEYWASLDGYVRTYKDRIPIGFVPIADDPGGNVYVLGTAEPYNGHTYFWNHELEADEGEEPTFENMSFVASSFTNLLSQLREFDEDAA